jgi:hypothetical protein
VRRAARRSSIPARAPRSVPSSDPRRSAAARPAASNRHPAGVAIRFLALDALKAWQQEGLPSLKVQGASAWQKAREKEIRDQNALILEYDWTYTSPYTGTIVPGYSDGGGGDGGDDGAAVDGGGGGGGGSSSSSITTSIGAAGPAAAGAQGVAASPPSSPSSRGQAPLQWQPTSRQIDRSVLMQREPILYYDDVPLYESELDDNGTCQLSAKVGPLGRGRCSGRWRGLAGALLRALLGALLGALLESCQAVVYHVQRAPQSAWARPGRRLRHARARPAAPAPSGSPARAPAAAAAAGARDAELLVRAAAPLAQGRRQHGPAQGDAPLLPLRHARRVSGARAWAR